MKPNDIIKKASEIAVKDIILPKVVRKGKIKLDMKQLTKSKEELIKEIKQLPLLYHSKTFKETDRWCKEHPEHSPFIVIIDLEECKTYNQKE